MKSIRLWRRYGKHGPELRRGRRFLRPYLEVLEARTLLSATGMADVGNTLATAAEVDLSPAGSAGRLGFIDRAGDVDVYRFVAPRGGGLSVRLIGAGTELDTDLTALDAAGRVLACNDDRGANDRASQVAFDVAAGQTYYVQAADSPRSSSGTGEYVLLFSTYADDFGGTPATAQPLDLPAEGTFRQDGRVEEAGDRDLFRFTAPATGGLVVTQGAAPDSPLDSALTVLDAGGGVLARNDDSGDGLDSRVVLSVAAGQVYYVQAAASPAALRDAATGAYTLTFHFYDDPVGNRPADAAPLYLLSSGATARLSSIEVPGDVDVYRYVAPATGGLAVTQRSAAGSSLVSVVSAFDGTGTPVGRPDRGEAGPEGRVVFHVTAGQTYYVQAAGRADSTGAYVLTLAPYADDFGDTPADAQALAQGPGGQEGNLEVPGDVDLFRFEAPQTGETTVRMESAGDPPGGPADPARRERGGDRPRRRRGRRQPGDRAVGGGADLLRPGGRGRRGPGRHRRRRLPPHGGPVHGRFQRHAGRGPPRRPVPARRGQPVGPAGRRRRHGLVPVQVPAHGGARPPPGGSRRE
jgi:hypothetical protein